MKSTIVPIAANRLITVIEAKTDYLKDLLEMIPQTVTVQHEEVFGEIKSSRRNIAAAVRSELNRYAAQAESADDEDFFEFQDVVNGQFSEISRTPIEGLEDVLLYVELLEKSMKLLKGYLKVSNRKPYKAAPKMDIQRFITNEAKSLERALMIINAARLSLLESLSGAERENLLDIIDKGLSSIWRTHKQNIRLMATWSLVKGTNRQGEDDLFIYKSRFEPVFDILPDSPLDVEGYGLSGVEEALEMVRSIDIPQKEEIVSAIEENERKRKRRY